MPPAIPIGEASDLAGVLAEGPASYCAAPGVIQVAENTEGTDHIAYARAVLTHLTSGQGDCHGGVRYRPGTPGGAHPAVSSKVNGQVFSAGREGAAH